MMKNRRSMRGYSMIEILTVLGIIGVLSLVTVPAFLNMQRRMHVRSALRDFTATMRRCRDEAIQKNRLIKVEIVPSTKPKERRQYRTFFSTNNGATWPAFILFGSYQNNQWLPVTMYFDSTTFTGDAVIFKPDGTVQQTGQIIIRTDWKPIIDTITVEVSAAGQVKSTEKKS